MPEGERERKRERKRWEERGMRECEREIDRQGTWKRKGKLHISGERREPMLAMVVVAVAAGYDDGGVVAITVEGCVDRWSSDVTGRGMLRRHGDRQRTRPSSSR